VSKIYRVCAGLILFALLCGCGLPGAEYRAEEDPAPSAAGESPPYVKISSYAGLVRELRKTLENTGGEIFMLFDGYHGDPGSDVERAVRYVKTSLPEGCFALESLDYTSCSAGGAFAARFSLRYRRTEAEIKNLKKIFSLDEYTRLLAISLDSAVRSLDVALRDPAADIAELRRAAEDAVRNYAYYCGDGLDFAEYPSDGDYAVFSVCFRRRGTDQSVKEYRAAAAEAIASFYAQLAEEYSLPLEDADVCFLAYRYLLDTEYAEYGGGDAYALSSAYGPLALGTGDSFGLARAFRALCAAFWLDARVEATEDGGETRYFNSVELNGEMYYIDIASALKSATADGKPEAEKFFCFAETGEVSPYPYDYFDTIKFPSEPEQ